MSIVFRDDDSSDGGGGGSPPARGTVQSSFDGDSMRNEDAGNDNESLSSSYSPNGNNSMKASSGGMPGNRRHRGVAGGSSSDKENGSPITGRRGGGGSPQQQFGNISQCLKTNNTKDDEATTTAAACRNSFLEIEQLVHGSGSYQQPNKESSSSSTGGGGSRPKMIFSPNKTPTASSAAASPFLQASSDHRGGGSSSIAEFNLLGSPAKIPPSPHQHRRYSFGSPKKGGGKQTTSNDDSANNNTSRVSINYFDPIQCAGLVTFSDITSFMMANCGTISASSTTKITFHVLDYLMVLHQVSAAASSSSNNDDKADSNVVDLSSICWSTNPVRSQLEHNAHTFLAAAEEISTTYGIPPMTDSYLIKFGCDKQNPSSRSAAASVDTNRFVPPVFEPVPAHNDIFQKYQREAALESSPTNFLSSPSEEFQHHNSPSSQQSDAMNSLASSAAAKEAIHTIVTTALIDSVDPGGVHLALQSWLYRAHLTIASSANAKKGDQQHQQRLHRPSAVEVRSNAMRKYCVTHVPLKAMYEQGYNEAAQHFAVTSIDRQKDMQAAAAADAAKLQAQKSDNAASKSRFAMVPNCANRPHRSNTPPPAVGGKRERGASSSTAGPPPTSRKPALPESARRSSGSGTTPGGDHHNSNDDLSQFTLSASPYPNLSDLSRPRYTLEEQVSDVCISQVVVEALEEQLHQAYMKFLAVLGESNEDAKDQCWEEMVEVLKRDASEFSTPRVRL